MGFLIDDNPLDPFHLCSIILFIFINLESTTSLGLLLSRCFNILLLVRALYFIVSVNVHSFKNVGKPHLWLSHTVFFTVLFYRYIIIIIIKIILDYHSLSSYFFKLGWFFLLVERSHENSSVLIIERLVLLVLFENVHLIFFIILSVKITVLFQNFLYFFINLWLSFYVFGL